MNKINNEINEKLEILYEKYRNGLPQKLDAIKSIYRSFLDMNNNSSIDFLESALHDLAGSAGTYGLNQLSQLAKNAEQQCQKIKKTQQVNTHRINKLGEFIDKIINTNFKNDDNLFINEFKNISIINRIDIYSEDMPFTENLTKHFIEYGYRHKHLKTLNSYFERNNDTLSRINIIDLDSIEQLILFSDKKDCNKNEFTNIILYPDDSFYSRLMAVRAGCDVFIKKPIDFNVLNSIILEDFNDSHSGLYKILIVNDQQEQIDYYTLILEQANFNVVGIKEPDKVLATLDNHSFDAILLDIHMPTCNGLELAKVIRQYRHYFDIPILFISSTDIKDKLLQIRSSGGDDYLVKPVNPTLLIDTVHTKAKRYRAVLKIMNSDSLTGLINHSNCKLRLSEEINRSLRYQRELSVSLIDIDFFKKVNDEYGHQAGDLVIKNLSNLLKIQLRQSDLIGRYGGEEFMVIMPETNINNALIAIEKIRVLFSRQCTQYKDHLIKCTFSAGISSLKKEDNVSSLIECADNALYKAKRNGRNRIVSHMETNSLK